MSGVVHCGQLDWVWAHESKHGLEALAAAAVLTHVKTLDCWNSIWHTFTGLQPGMLPVIEGLGMFTASADALVSKVR